MVKAILTKPLDGQPEGTEREFSKTDFEMLKKKGAVRAASDLLEDGPTIAEFVAAGYKAENYPPKGYAARSTPEEIAAALAAEQKHDAPPSTPEPAPTDDSPPQDQAKAAQAPANKKAPPVANKSAI